ncbi:hypothetical protein HOB87_10095 [Candidatus Woesearchaeota archaeon]|jgi:D-alanyl-D-alanine carboxypeptidase|nr:hypothetical protein [Candidatus Woesearchaeota archaeon]
MKTILITLALIISLASSAESILNGKVVETYQDGSKKISKEYKNNQPFGAWTTWYEDGVKNSEVEFIKGALIKNFKFYHKNGKVNFQGFAHLKISNPNEGFTKGVDSVSFVVKAFDENGTEVPVDLSTFQAQIEDASTGEKYVFPWYDGKTVFSTVREFYETNNIHLNINAKSYALVESNSTRVISSKDRSKKVAPASLTKLMTAYVVFDSLASNKVSLEDDIVISDAAWNSNPNHNSIFKKGSTVKLEALLKDMIITSSNESAVALAEHISGTENAFTLEMNKQADQLRMVNSNFTNSTGLPNSNNYTTAFDIALLTAATIKNYPEFYKWYSQKEFTYKGNRRLNRNKLLWLDDKIDGLKTGFLLQDGYSLATSAIDNNVRLIFVSFGTSNPTVRTNQAKDALNYIFSLIEK